MLKRNKITRLLSFALIIALVLVSVSVKEVKADENGRDVFIITSFEEQTDQMPDKSTFEQGTKTENMGFPTNWNVKGYVSSDESKTVQERNLTGLTWKGILKDTTSEKEEASYYSGEAGEYIFTPRLPEGYQAEEGAKLPQMQIKITGKTVEEETESEKTNPEPEKKDPEPTPEITEPEKKDPESEPTPEITEPEKKDPEPEPTPEITEPEKKDPEPEPTPEVTEPEKKDPESEPTPEITEPEKKDPEPEPTPEVTEPEKKDPEPEPTPEVTEPEKKDPEPTPEVTEPEKKDPEPELKVTDPEPKDSIPVEKPRLIADATKLPERLLVGKEYELSAYLENAENITGIGEMQCRVPEAYKEIVSVSKGNKEATFRLKVLKEGEFQVEFICEGTENSPVILERLAEKKDSDATIKTFALGDWAGTIEHGSENSDGVIKVTLPYNTDVTNMVPVFTAGSAYAKVSPESGKAQDFSKKVVYTVTAEDGSTKTYEVKIQFACVHQWKEAACTEPETCIICKEKRGKALGHQWKEATCTTPETCARCGEKRGNPLEHTWIPADCTTPETCASCKVTRGSALGHSWGKWKTIKKPTTKEGGIEQRICERCKAEEKRDIPRLNIIGKPENNKVSGIQNKGIYRVDQLITITAHGDGMDIDKPIANDVRYLPIGWKVTSYYEMTKSPYQVSFSVKREGDYQLQVYFRKQVYDGKNWISKDETDVKKFNFTISNSRIMPAKTGDETMVREYLLLGGGALLVLLANIGWALRKRRKD